MGFDKTFGAWLEAALSIPVPDAVHAFSFNLNESGNAQSPFSVELVGCPDFDADDDDWACDVVWPATVRRLEIPVTFSTELWETCLEKLKALVLMATSENSGNQILRTREAIAVGFVDGDLHLVWQK